MELCNCNNTYIPFEITQISTFDKDHADTNGLTMRIGKNSRGFKYRVLLKFNFNNLPKKSEVLKATLTLSIQSVAPENNSHEIRAFSLNSPWDPRTVAWNNQPSINHNNRLFNKSVDKWTFYSFDLTNEVRYWYNCPFNNFGMILMTDEDLWYNTLQICTDQELNNLSLLVDYHIEQNIHITATPLKFCEYTEEILALPGIEYFTSTSDISLTKTVAYFVINNGTSPINIIFEYSPDGRSFVKEDRVLSVAASSSEVLFPIYFSKYIRLSITASAGGLPATVSTWLQLQQ